MCSLVSFFLFFLRCYRWSVSYILGRFVFFFVFFCILITGSAYFDFLLILM